MENKLIKVISFYCHPPDVHQGDLEKWCMSVIPASRRDPFGKGRDPGNRKVIMNRLDSCLRRNDNPSLHPARLASKSIAGRCFKMTNNNMKLEEIKKIVKNSYDLHYHCGPDVLPRKYDDADKLISSQKNKIKGVALKIHSLPSQSTVKNGLQIIGSITLNNYTGGLNDSSLYACKNINKNQPFIVWLPTMHAQNHLDKNYSQYEIPPEWVGDENFIPRKKKDIKGINILKNNTKILKPEINKLINDIKKYHFILATGHVSTIEAVAITKYARKLKIPTIITHPMQKDINMSLATQIKLSKLGAYIEYCYVMWLDRDNPSDYPLEKIVANIKKIGVEHCILSSDGGQTRNGTPSQCLINFIKLLSKYDLTKNDFEQMLIKNPKKILNIK